jgi:hypothetical protein
LASPTGFQTPTSSKPPPLPWRFLGGGFTTATTPAGENLGENVGASVSKSVGEKVGFSAGKFVGNIVGASVGFSVGTFVGKNVGVGASVGKSMGEKVGSAARRSFRTKFWWRQRMPILLEAGIHIGLIVVLLFVNLDLRVTVFLGLHVSDELQDPSRAGRHSRDILDN